MSKKTSVWPRVREQIDAGTFPSVFVAADGRLNLDESAGFGKPKTLPPEIAALYPPAIVAEAQARATAQAAARQAEQARLDAEREAILARYRHVRAWRLAGLLLEDRSMARYTLAEIEAWSRWDGPAARHEQPDLAAILERSEADGGEYRLDLAGYFADYCGEGRPRPSFELFCERLAAYTADRRNLAAPKN